MTVFSRRFRPVPIELDNFRWYHRKRLEKLLRVHIFDLKKCQERTFFRGAENLNFGQPVRAQKRGFQAVDQISRK